MIHLTTNERTGAWRRTTDGDEYQSRTWMNGGGGGGYSKYEAATV